jgi:type I restriction enzyme S subunit
MAKYQQYAEYKDSGVEWLGEVPSHWEINRHKYVASFVKGRNPTELSDDYVEGYFPYLSMDSLRGKSHSKFAPLVKGLFLAVDGQPLIIWDGSNAGEFVLGKEGIVSSTMAAAFLNVPLDHKYYWYLCLCLEPEMRRHANGMGIPHVNGDELKNIKLGVPAKLEQTQITNFLDHESAQIDALIEKQQTLIQLLKEKRQAVISHAVTKGLNPDVPMKNSGVEWLGEVPEHWGVIQAKHIADITRGAILRPVDAPEYFDENGEWAYLNISDATKCDKYLYESKLRLSPLGSTKSARVYPNNLIITASATIGKAFINKVKVCIHDGFIPFCNIKVDINYLYHYVSNPYLYAAMGKSNTQKNIYLDEVKNMVVTVPPRAEQENIVEHIEKNQNEYSKLIGEAEKAIQLMQERRTALISAAVTGKIDVRDWQAPNVETL